jgi:hypothetical protein
MATWHGLDTRRGQLIEMAATLASAKGQLQSVLLDYPSEAEGSAQLEQAIGLVGIVTDEIEGAAEQG